MRAPGKKGTVAAFATAYDEFHQGEHNMSLLGLEIVPTVEKTPLTMNML